MDDRFSDAGAERGHALREPARNAATMERKIGESRSFHVWAVLPDSGKTFTQAIAKAVGRDDEENLKPLVAVFVDSELRVLFRKTVCL